MGYGVWGMGYGIWDMGCGDNMIRCHRVMFTLLSSCIVMVKEKKHQIRLFTPPTPHVNTHHMHHMYVNVHTYVHVLHHMSRTTATGSL